jgi:hypothetical protein
MHGPGVVKVPPPSTFNRYAALALPGRYSTGSAKTRQSADNQPDKVYGVITASRPGEMLARAGLDRAVAERLAALVQQVQAVEDLDRVGR